MNALLILAHGSRQKESNDEIVRLAKELDESGDTGFDTVICAFNQFSPPTAQEQIRRLVDSGVQKITILPYFIAGGSHVKTDIPELIQEAGTIHPHVQFILTPHFGAFKGIKDVIISELSK
jgi:sirohydrochlorin ferrochelatase